MSFAHNRNSSAAFNKLFQMVKETEATCAHLLSNAKVADGQLKALRAEHENMRLEADALRRCLTKSGVLSAAELEEELRRMGVKPSAPPVKSLFETPTKTKAAATSPTRTMSGQQPLTRSSRFTSPVRGRSPGERARGQASPSETVCRASASRDPSELPALPIQTEKVEARALRSAGRSPNFQSLMETLLENDASTELLQQAIRSLQSVLKQNPDVLHTYVDADSPNSSALSAAVRKGRLDLTKVLLKARANPNERDDKGVTALHLATFDGHLDLCKVLLLSRANVDACDRHGQTPLFFAPSKDVCKLLIERNSDVNVLNRRGQSALHMAGRAGLHEVLGWLSTRVSQTLAELKDVHGLTAKTYAKMSGVPLPIPTPIPVRSPSSTSPNGKGRQGPGPDSTRSLGVPRRSGSLRSLGTPSVRSGRSSPSGNAHAFDFFEVARSTSPASPPSRERAQEVQEAQGDSCSPPLPGQLPCHSRFVADHSMTGIAGPNPSPLHESAPHTLDSMYAGFESLEQLQKMRGRTNTLGHNLLDQSSSEAKAATRAEPTLTALAAAAAVATAAVSTAAELTPGTSNAPAAVTGPLHAPAAAPSVPQAEGSAVDLAARGVVGSAEDLAAAGVMDGDDLAAAGVMAGAEDLAAAGVMEEDDLAAAGVVIDDDLAAAGVLIDGEGMADLGVYEPGEEQGDWEEEEAGEVLVDATGHPADLLESLDECF